MNRIVRIEFDGEAYTLKLCTLTIGGFEKETVASQEFHQLDWQSNKYAAEWLQNGKVIY